MMRKGEDNRLMHTKWDERFIRLAQHIAGWSKDPSTKVGAVIVDEHRRIVGTGYNGFARGVDDSEERYEDRALKHELVVHAEINAVLNAVKQVRGCTLYSTFFPCPRCAATIIQAGILRVVHIPSPSDQRYAESRQLAQRMFDEAQIEVICRVLP